MEAELSSRRRSIHSRPALGLTSREPDRQPTTAAPHWLAGVPAQQAMPAAGDQPQITYVRLQQDRLEEVVDFMVDHFFTREPTVDGSFNVFRDLGASAVSENLMLAVDPRYCGLGVGSELCRRTSLEGAVRSGAPVSLCFCTSSTTQHIYERLGFEIEVHSHRQLKNEDHQHNQDYLSYSGDPGVDRVVTSPPERGKRGPPAPAPTKPVLGLTLEIPTPQPWPPQNRDVQKVPIPQSAIPSLNISATGLNAASALRFPD
ncbi:uncharacterized protein LOC119104263 isoform X3 [Pollicipes pollicipes]|uniref:uncharacterized protein LOC119104263 isoform X3 n=1 Tax=Pollicipes pollicipes TaxID=41117 RepID=UPI001884A635|nr:uncharacterized protein LOC119104263 isoform X3 [Pollicipes pollicipes]